MHTKMTDLRDDLQDYEAVTEDEMEQVTRAQLKQFEIASLVNLNPETYDEAVTLVPSLHGRFQEEHVEWMLQRVSQDTGNLFS